MASYERSEYIENLTVNTINTRGDNNVNIPAFQFLTTDGQGGTFWSTPSSLSSLIYGASFHKIRTTVGTYTADQATNATFSLLDGPNAGLINDPTASNTAILYAKAFGQFDISGQQNSIVAFDPIANKVNSNVLFVGTGGITITGDPQTNTMVFDGRELPFVSTLPYSFNKMVVYSNVPANTVEASTNKSIVMEAQGPSSILSFVGEDVVVIKTNYAKNQIIFSLSTVTLPLLSTLFGNQAFLISTAVTNIQLSTLSTSYGQILSYDTFQSAISTMSTTIDNKIAYNSTIIGDVDRFSKGISSIWYTYITDRYIFSISTGSNIVSSASALQSEIDILYQQASNNSRQITTSTILTPYYWASTLVELENTNLVPIASNSPSVLPLNITYYPTYSSFYNVFNDTQPFGNPVSPPIYPTSVDLESGNTTISTMSTLANVKFSSMYALKGTFAFFPNDDPHTFSVSWKGNLAFNINGVDYTPKGLAYPRLDAFKTVENTITNTIIDQPICVVNFTYSKIQETDYLRFTNMTDYLDGVQSYSIAPIYNAYGYNTLEAPLFSESISWFPKTFSSLSNVAPYLELSTYVMVASTFYTSGCNTNFNIAANGYNGITFFESTTNISKVAYNQNLINGQSQNSGLTAYSASNAFDYSFGSIIPSSPYTVQLVYGRQTNSETFLISSLYTNELGYKYTAAIYMSSILYLSNVSSYNGEFVYLNLSNFTVIQQNVSSIYASSLVTYDTVINNLNVSSISSQNARIHNLVTSTLTTSTITAYDALVDRMNVSSLSSYNATITNLNASSLVTYNAFINNLNVSSISSQNARIDNLVVCTITAYDALVDRMNVSNLSSYNATITNLNASSLVTYNAFINNLNVSSISSYNITAINLSVSSISSSYADISALTISSINNYRVIDLGGNHPCTLSTFATYLNNINSTINVGLSSLMCTIMTNPIAELGNDVSTISTLYTNILLITSTISSSIDTFSTSLVDVGGGTDSSTISTLLTNVLFITSTMSTSIDSFSTSLIPVMESTIITSQLYASTIFASSINVSGQRQPFIQYGSNTTGDTVMLSTLYKDTTYAVQLTYSEGTVTTPLNVSAKTASQFNINGTASKGVFWTTFGDIF